MYLEGVLIEAKNLLNGASIVQPERVEKVEYYGHYNVGGRTCCILYFPEEVLCVYLRLTVGAHIGSLCLRRTR